MVKEYVTMIAWYTMYVYNTPGFWTRLQVYQPQSTKNQRPICAAEKIIITPRHDAQQCCRFTLTPTGGFTIFFFLSNLLGLRHSRQQLVCYTFVLLLSSFSSSLFTKRHVNSLVKQWRQENPLQKCEGVGDHVSYLNGLIVALLIFWWLL